MLETLSEFDDHAARAADRGHRAGEVADLPRPARRVRRRPDLARAAGRRRSRERRAPAPEGAAPRHAVRRRDRQAARAAVQRRGDGRVLQGPAPEPCRQAVALPRLVGQLGRGPERRRPAHRHACCGRSASASTRSARPRPARSWPWPRSTRCRPASRCRPRASRRPPTSPAAEPPVFALSLAAKNRNDEVKLSGALHKIVEEDPSLSFEARGETHELLIRGQGEMHLKVAVDKLAGRYNVAVETETPRVAYRETIQGGSQQHARYKRQTGGHGQFADIKVEIKPLAARLGLPLRRQDRGRRGAAQLHPGGRGGPGRVPQGRPARPAGGRPRGHAVRRPVPLRRQLGNVVQDGGAHRHERGHAQVQAGAAGAHPQGDGGGAQRRRRRASSA